MFFEKKIDCRTKESMAKFLASHRRYSTMNSWNNMTSYANTVKVRSLGLSGSQLDKAYELIGMEDLHHQINMPIDEFTSETDGAYTIGFNGRSSGYMVLYRGEYYDPGYKSYCPKCHQKNYQSVPAGMVASCGKCGTARVNFDKPLRWHKAHSTGIDHDLSFEDFMDLSMTSLKDKVELIRRFDQVCDEVRSEFIAVINDFMIVEETVMVPQKIRRLERLAF